MQDSMKHNNKWIKIVSFLRIIETKSVLIKVNVKTWGKKSDIYLVTKL